MSAFNFVETLAIGDELLTGKVSDTNSAFVGAQLFNLGIRLFRSSVIADDETEIIASLNLISERSRAAIVFGGLGPTSDDKTADTVCRLMGGSLRIHEPSKEKLIRIFAERKRTVDTTNLKQVHYPEKTEPLLNSYGLAPGFTMEWKGCRFFFLPGVPQEMKAIWAEHVLPRLHKMHHESGAATVWHRSWRLIGIPESQVQRLMDPVEAKLPSGAWLGYRTHYPENHLVLYVSSAVPNATECLGSFSKEIEGIVSHFVYTTEEKDLEVLVMEALKAKKWKLALAESCTGGLASHRITRIPGASTVFWGAQVVYQHEAKNTMLGLSLKSEEEAVSASCSRQLVDALAKKSGCEVIAAITGYMGPDGGTAEDPVGTFYIHVKTPDGEMAKRFFQPARDRERTQSGSTTHLFHEILEVLKRKKAS